MSEPSARALEVFSGHLMRMEEGENPDLEVLCGEHGDLADELRQLHEEWSRMSEVLERLGPKQGSLSLQLRERYGESVDPEISLSQPDEGGVADESSAALMDKLSAQGGSERYRARDEIARGGMGAILKVWDEDLRRPLAMKVALKEDGGTSGAATDTNSQKRLSRFLEEAQITSQLDHPGIVPVHDLGIDSEGRVYFTMQLVDGRDMRDVVALAERGEDGWDLRRLVGVLVRVCEALAYSHSKGVVHRDIKPGNVMVGKFGEVFVMDWGLAKVMGREEEFDAATSTIIHTLRSDGSSAEHTIAGDIVGTPAFMAPEQALGRGGEVGPASDLYAVGSMLYLMLTGQIPYQPLGESVSALTILDAVKTGPPWPIRKINPDAPPELIAVCEKAMAREIPDRFTDAMALGDELRNWLEGHAVATYETGVFYALRKWVGRNKGMAATLIGLFLVVLGGLGLLFQQQQENILDLQEEQTLTKEAQEDAEENLVQARKETGRANRETDRANEKSKENFDLRQAALASVERQTALAQKSRRAGYRAQIITAWFSLRLHEANRTRQHLEGVESDLKGWEWGYLSLGADSSTRGDIAHPKGSLDLVAGGDEVVSMGSDAVARVFDTVDWSHEDLSVRVGMIASVGLPRGGAVPMGRIVCALNANGVFASATQSSAISLWNLEKFDFMRVLTAEGAVTQRAPVMDLAFSADGQFLASVDHAGGVRVWNILSLRQPVFWETNVGVPLRCVALHPTEKQIAFGAENGVVEVWEYGEGEGRRLDSFVEDHESPINALEYSHDGLMLAGAAEDGEVVLRDRFTEFPGLAELSGIPTEGDSTGLGVALGNLRSGLERSGKEWGGYKLKSRLRGHRQGVTCLSFSWDDQVVYAGGKDATVRAWSPMDGSEQGVWEGHKGEVHGLAILPGELVLSGSKDGTLNVFDPYWDGLRQELSGDVGAPILFVGEDSSGVGALALNATGTIVRERPEDALGAARSLTSTSASWVVGTQVGEYVALAGEDEVVQLFDLSTGAVVRTLEGHDADIVDLASSESGVRMITGSSDSRAIVWEGLGPDEELTHWSISHNRGVVAVAMSADATVVATADKDKSIQLWDTSSRTKRSNWQSAHDFQIVTLAVSPDGERVASGSRRELRLFKRGRAEPLADLSHLAEVRAIAFNEDGKRLVSGDADGNLYLWDLGTPTLDEGAAERLIELYGHEAAITSIHFADEGRTLISGDASGVVFAWRSDRDPERYERWQRTERTHVRQKRIMKYFDGDHEVAYQRLKEGVPGLSKNDPAVEHLLRVLAPISAAGGK